jgi:hypothetical protein
MSNWYWVIAIFITTFTSGLFCYLLGRDVGERSVFMKKTRNEERLRTALYESRYEIQRLRLALQRYEDG